MATAGVRFGEFRSLLGRQRGIESPAGGTLRASILSASTRKGIVILRCRRVAKNSITWSLSSLTMAQTNIRVGALDGR
jgi:hypothetical protein